MIREIGRGGMGSVYLAERDDEQYESEDAIKLVRPGFDTNFILRRFKRERHILARLQHLNSMKRLRSGLIWAMGQALELVFDKETLTAWDQLLSTISAAMLEAAATVPIEKQL